MHLAEKKDLPDGEREIVVEDIFEVQDEEIYATEIWFLKHRMKKCLDLRCEHVA